MAKYNGKRQGQLLLSSQTFLADDTFSARCVLIFHIMDLKPGMYIEGTYSRQNNQGLLNEVQYVGLQPCGPVIYATSSGIFDEFTFVDLLTPEGNQVSTNSTKQWNYIPSSYTWQNNSEFTPSGNTVVKEEFKSALVMLVLDCSSSLSTDFQSVKNAARQFIETLNGNTHQ